MKCSVHPSNCGEGVCAFCLRERLSIITGSLAGNDDLLSPDDTQRSSVPPLLGGRQSALNKFDGKNLGARKLSLESPSPKKAESDDAVSGPSGSPSCLPGLTLGRKKRNKMTSLHVDPVNTRGMSPVSDEAAARGGLSAKQSPSRCTSSPPIRRQQSPRSFSSLALCLSPLGRPIPGNHGGNNLPDMTLPVKIRGTFNQQCGRGGGGGGIPDLPSALGTSRSRKLADLGKIW
ncbi:hypothetical protein KSP40_PGU021456 [Platanthera guangdongensis]|uniref:Uncharacterized protein n=1 Tax=Platanthera guangdongensis TaxID=2320717 RepID=A0ABR2LNG0_9ASPA